MKLYFIRHGEVTIKNNEYFRAHLSKEGIEQGKQLLEKGVLPKPDKIYSSHFVRAQESAKILAKHFQISVTIKKCLGEWKIQELNIQFDKFLEEEKQARENLNLIVSGGESFAMARERIYNCTTEICKENPQVKNLIIVSHGNVLYLLFKKLLNQEPTFNEESEQIKLFDYGIIEYSDKKFRVIRNIITKPT
ncbi:hypothetical protein A3K72_01725 [Candidatus Woesearchaeota archaeon RBG_13_36_6]|nr:MAG: hypothetical protein A3K72_01725 [Candidatus Woesearchaeota archaeon RBG_13_36_6]